MTASDEQARNVLHQERMLRKQAMLDARIAGAARDRSAPPDLTERADTVAEIRVIRHAPGIRAQRRIEL